MISREELFSFKLAVLFHDPPWKPWGMFTNAFRLTESGKSYSDLIADSIKDEISNLKRQGLSEWAKNVAGGKEFLKLDGNTEIKIIEVLNSIKGYIDSNEFKEKIRMLEGSSLKSHEIQAYLLPLLIKRALDYLSNLDSNLRPLVDLISKTLYMLERRDPRIHEADSLSSALDRTIIYSVERFLQEKRSKSYRISDKDPVFKNIFDPKAQIEVKGNMSVRTLARFIIFYLILLVASILRSNAIDEGLFYSIAYSLLEPSWYIIAKEPPPADTRIPTHTIFDHLSAATAIANWYIGGNVPQGCLIRVDLASVQSWIKESRRLRDLWAASWLASWLTWRSVKSFVEELGPDIMIQPPSRLHPFFTANLLSKICGKELNDNFCKYLADILGLANYWPLDPTVPSTALLAIPAIYCGEVKEKIVNNYKEAWRKVVKYVVDDLSELYRNVQEIISKNREICNDDISFTCDIAENFDELKDLLLNIEPPLPLRVFNVNINAALEGSKKICKLINERAEKIEDKDISAIINNMVFQDTVSECDKLLLYQTLMVIKDEESVTGLRASGRRSGRNYLEMAQKIYDLGHFKNCLMCGSGMAIVDGRELLNIIDRAKSVSVNKIKDFVLEISNERLCIYCLVKRFLRRIVGSHADELVGLHIKSDVKDRIGGFSVIEFTARAKLGRRRIEEITGKLVKDRTFVNYAIANLHKVPSAIAAFMRSKENEEYNLVRAFVIEAAHDRALADYFELQGEKELAEKLRNISNDRELNSYRRYYAIVAADGDLMGKGVLRGNLNIDPKEYIKSALNIDDENAIELAVKLYDFIIKGYEEAVCSFRLDPYCNKSKDAIKKTMLVTPSYHFTISRALAAQSLFDRNLVEKLQGALIYSGGDDLLAIVPPANVYNDKKVYVALTLAYLSRLRYWGELRPKENRLGSLDILDIYFNYFDKEGFSRLSNNIVIPALRAFGRSTVIYYVDSKRPLWLAVEEAHNILDSKDHVNIHIIGRDGKEMHANMKDLLFIGSESSALVVLPFTLLKLSKSVSHMPVNIFKLLDEIGKEEKRKYLSISLIYDIINYITELKTLQEKGRIEALKLLMKNIIYRNINAPSGSEKEKYVNEIFNLIYGNGYVDNIDIGNLLIKVSKESAAGELMKMSPYAIEEYNYVYAPVVSQIFGAIKVTRSSIGG